MSIEEETLTLLRSIDKRLGQLVAMGSRSGTSGASEGGRSGGDVASDAELDSQYGDPEIKYDPKEKWWTGASFVGRTFSRCSPEYLDAYAKSCEARAYAISKDPEGDPKKAGYAAKDARLARGWAARVRANPPKVKKPSPPPDHDDMDQSDIPF